MSCVINYKDKKYSQEDFKAIAAVHQSIKEDLEKTRMFRKIGNDLYESKFDVSKVNAGRAEIGRINEKFGAVVVNAKSSNRKIEINLNPVAQTIIAAQRQSTNPRYIQGQFLFQKLSEEKDKNNPNSIINSAIKSFLDKNNIPVQYWKSLTAITGEDASGTYDTVNRTILIAEGKEDLDTLPEETGHVVVETVGTNHPLVKALLHHVSQMDYMSIVGEDYAKTYGNNKDLLIREAAAKLIGKAIVGKLVGPDAISERPMNLIQRILHSFFNLFTHTSNFKDHMKEAENKASQIADKVFAGEVIDNRYSNFQNQPTNQFFFQKGTKERKVSDKTQQELASRLNYIERKISKLRAQIKVETNEDRKTELNERLSTLVTKFGEYKNNPSLATITEVMRPLLFEVQKFIDKVEKGEINVDETSQKDIEFAKEVVQRSKQTNIASEAIQLEKRLDDIVDQLLVHRANKELGMPEELGLEDINEIEQDINKVEMGFGAVVNKNVKVAQTAAIVIKKAQNRIARFDERVTKDIDDQISKLIKYQKSVGVAQKDFYNVFIQTSGKTTVLTREYNPKFYTDRNNAYEDVQSEDTEVKEKGFKWFKDNIDAERDVIPRKEYENANYKKIQSTKELKEFYDFYKKTTAEAFDKLPVNGGENFIPNLSDKTLMDIFRSQGTMKGVLGAIEDIIGAREIRSGSINEDLFSDEIPLRFVGGMDEKSKTRDLGNALSVFAKFANAHNEMSEVLPFARIAQEKIREKEFKSSVVPGKTYSGEKSNIYHMLKTYIDMQVKGEMKTPFKKFEYDGYDENGKPTRKFFDIGKIIDLGIKYNSLLRIGFNPFLAVSNVAVGEANNFIDAVGGRFFTVKNLTEASGIFYSQIYNKNSKLVTIIKKLKILRQLDEYQPVNQDKLKLKHTVEWIEKYMYAPQSRGELFIQSRAMTASMLHDQIIDNKGIKHSLWEAFDDKGIWKKELFGELTDERIGRITNRIQEIIAKAQGRYSSEDAAILSQNVLFRAAFQFKKWIPAAVESRMDKRVWNPLLQEYDEGRWRTVSRLLKEAFSKEPGKRGYMDMIQSVFSAKKRLEQGGLSELEVANIRKNLIEIVILAATITLASYFLGSDYRKKHKDIMTDPGVKFAFDQLNRISGDLIFFTSPGQMSQMATNLIPLIKTTDDIGTALRNLPYAFGGVDADYKKGTMKGENRFWGRAIPLIPVLNPVIKVVRNFKKDISAPDYNQQGR